MFMNLFKLKDFKLKVSQKFQQYQVSITVFLDMMKAYLETFVCMRRLYNDVVDNDAAAQNIISLHTWKTWKNIFNKMEFYKTTAVIDDIVGGGNDHALIHV